MRTQIPATDDLYIELWPAAPNDPADRPLLKLRSKSADKDGEDRSVIVYLDEVKRLVGALTDAAVELTTETAMDTRAAAAPIDTDQKKNT